MAEKWCAPDGLGDSGVALWVSIADKYDLRSDEARVLADACREADLIDRIESEMSDSPMIVKGSMGQPAINPMVSELRQHRGTLARMLGQLKLPDEPGEGGSGESNQQRAAVNTRWSRRGA